MVHVIATIEIKPGTRAAFLKVFHALTPLVRMEDGCKEYGASFDVGADLAAQPPLREDTVIIVEKWADLAALKVHLQAPHMNDYRIAVKDIVTSVQLQVLQPV